MSDNRLDLLEVIGAVQEGDYETVESALSQRVVNVNTKDKDNCSLLHWAAINNRVKIANLLIDYGANSFPGGILMETPFQWALRKKYYVMMKLLFQKLHVDLRHKSKQEIDALHLACRLGDANAVFLLLAWNCSPNSLDKDGNTPLLYMIKNDLSPNGIEIIKLLIQFGADVTIPEPTTKNTIVHLMAHQKKVDLSLIFYIYNAAPGIWPSLTNIKEKHVYAYAIENNNRRLARFLFDILLYYYFPYWTPTILSTILFASYPWFVHSNHLLLGSFYWGICYMFFSWGLLQFQVLDHRPRIEVGIFLGWLVILLLGFYFYLSSLTSSINSFLFLTSFCGLLWMAFRFHKQKPMVSKQESKSDLIKKIILSAPSEGTDEELKEKTGCKEETTLSKSSSKNRLVRNAFTGKVDLVKVEKPMISDLEEWEESRIRSLGPKICGHCLCDKRSFTSIEPTSSGSTNKPNAKPTNNSSTNSSANSTTASSTNTTSNQKISIATHCNFCNACVIDPDHHCTYLANCVGRNNRRLFLGFLLLMATTNILYFMISKWFHYSIYCHGMFKWTIFSALQTEYCLLMKFPDIFLVEWISCMVLVMFVVLLESQMVFICRETTLTNVIKKRYVFRPPPAKKQWKNLIHFFKTGQYSVIYPKNPLQDTPEPCCDKHKVQGNNKGTTENPMNHLGNGIPPADQSVKNLLNRIEADMGISKPIDEKTMIKPGESMKNKTVRIAPDEIPDRHASSHKSSKVYFKETIDRDVENNINNSATNVTQTAIVSPPSAGQSYKSSQGQDSNSRKHYHENDDDEEDHDPNADEDYDEYDSEFAESELNSYHQYYWRESDSDDGNNHHDHQDYGDEESALLMNSRR